MQGKLVSRNVTVGGHRTSLRLGGATWAALDQICALGQNTIHELCTMIERFRHGSSRTSMVRAFIVSYFRTAANDGGEMQGGILPKLLEQAS